ncbi:MAG: serine protease [Ilumatobacteraceae bacterium]
MGRWSTAALGLVVGSTVAFVAACGGDDDAPPLAVVTVEATGCDRPQPRFGAGTFVADGVVLTAAHVVEGDLRDLTVGGAPAAVVGLDIGTDLALVALVGAADDTADWSVTAADDVAPGPVRIVTPDASTEAELLRTLTLRVDDISDDTVTERAALEVDVVVAAGDSGSPVVDADGDLIGVVVLRRPSTGVSYASVVPVFSQLLDQALYQDIRADPLARPDACT